MPVPVFVPESRVRYTSISRTHKHREAQIGHNYVGQQMGTYIVHVCTHAQVF